MRSCMSVTTLRIPQTLFTCDANVSTSCLWWHCTYHKTVAARIGPKKKHPQLLKCMWTALHAKIHRVSLSVFGEKVSEGEGGGGEKTTAKRRCSDKWKNEAAIDNQINVDKMQRQRTTDTSTYLLTVEMRKVCTCSALLSKQWECVISCKAVWTDKLSMLYLVDHMDVDGYVIDVWMSKKVALFFSQALVSRK